MRFQESRASLAPVDALDESKLGDGPYRVVHHDDSLPYRVEPIAASNSRSAPIPVQAKWPEIPANVTSLPAAKVVSRHSTLEQKLNIKPADLTDIVAALGPLVKNPDGSLPDSLQNVTIPDSLLKQFVPNQAAKIDFSDVMRENPRIPCEATDGCPFKDGICCSNGKHCCPSDATCLTTNPPTCVHDYNTTSRFRVTETVCKPDHQCPWQNVYTCCNGGTTCCPYMFRCQTSFPQTCVRISPTDPQAEIYKRAQSYVAERELRKQEQKRAELKHKLESEAQKSEMRRAQVDAAIAQMAQNAYKLSTEGRTDSTYSAIIAAKKDKEAKDEAARLAFERLERDRARGLEPTPAETAQEEATKKAASHADDLLRALTEGKTTGASQQKAPPATTTTTTTTTTTKAKL